jgi:hypothetical protein
MLDMIYAVKKFIIVNKSFCFTYLRMKSAHVSLNIKVSVYSDQVNLKLYDDYLTTNNKFVDFMSQIYYIKENIYAITSDAQRTLRRVLHKVSGVSAKEEQNWPSQKQRGLT